MVVGDGYVGRYSRDHGGISAWPTATELIHFCESGDRRGPTLELSPEIVRARAAFEVVSSVIRSVRAPQFCGPLVAQLDQNRPN